MDCHWIVIACYSELIGAPHFSQGGWGDAAQAAFFRNGWVVGVACDHAHPNSVALMLKMQEPSQ